jgi:hypothetical protein
MADIVLQALNDLTEKHGSMRMIDQDMAWILGADYYRHNTYWSHRPPGL